MLEPTVEPIDRTRLALFEDKWGKFIKAVENVPCETHEQQNYWGKVLAEANHAINEVEKDRKELIAPILESQRTTNAAFKKAVAFAEAVKDLAKDKIAGAREANLKAQETARLAASTAAAAGDTKAVMAAVQSIPDELAIAGAGGRWEWVASVVNKALVPSDYLVVDEKRLKDYAKAFAKSESIPCVPGIHWTRKSVVIAGRT